MLVLPPNFAPSGHRLLLHMLKQGLRVHRDSTVVVDAHALTVFDTSALAVLLGRRREACPGKQFAVQGMPAGLVGMAGLYGVDALLVAAP